MTSSELLEDLEAMGFQVESDGDRLFIRPREMVSANLVERIKPHKPALVELLKTRSRIRDQIGKLNPYSTPDGRRGWVHPRYHDELDRNGLL